MSDYKKDELLGNLQKSSDSISPLIEASKLLYEANQHLEKATDKELWKSKEIKKHAWLAKVAVAKIFELLRKEKAMYELNEELKQLWEQ